MFCSQVARPEIQVSGSQEVQVSRSQKIQVSRSQAAAACCQSQTNKAGPQRLQ